MSRTDKTRPVWVQFRDPENRRFMREDHDHRNGVCNFAEWMDGRQVYGLWRMEDCCLYESYYGSRILKAWPRQPCRGARYNRHRMIRTRWVRARQAILAGADPDSMELIPTSREYDSWMWENWHS
jgi:hypothetical protein